MTTNQLTIGLFGFGVVGKGLYDVLQATPTLKATIKKIAIRDPAKPRPIAAGHFTTDAGELLNDDSINVIVELIDDADAAFHIVKTALQNGKAVVSANKKMIAGHFEELLHLQRKHQVPFLYEAACCASLPIVRNLEEYYDNDLLQSIRGIINGSTNYILTKMQSEGLDYGRALLQAQQLGFAESNPELDTKGYDASNKLCILLAHAFGIISKPGDVLFSGIEQIDRSDARYADEKKYRIKPVAEAKKLKNGKLAAVVLPRFVEKKDDLFQVQDEFNALVTEGVFADKHFIKGKGAGAFPTASAVLSDISALRYNYKYEYKKLNSPSAVELSDDFYLKVYLRATELNNIKKEDFEYIEEWQNDLSQCRLTGVIHVQKLLRSGWWKEPGTSLILAPGGIIDDIDYLKISKRSLELAGVV